MTVPSSCTRTPMHKPIGDALSQPARSRLPMPAMAAIATAHTEPARATPDETSIQRHNVAAEPLWHSASTMAASMSMPGTHALAWDET